MRDKKAQVNFFLSSRHKRKVKRKLSFLKSVQRFLLASFLTIKSVRNTFKNNNIELKMYTIYLDKLSIQEIYCRAGWRENILQNLNKCIIIFKVILCNKDKFMKI